MFWKILIAAVVVFCIYTTDESISIVLEDMCNLNETIVRVIAYIAWVAVFIVVADMWIMFCV